MKYAPVGHVQRDCIAGFVDLITQGYLLNKVLKYYKLYKNYILKTFLDYIELNFTGKKG